MTLIFYSNERGDEPVREFLDKLSKPAREKTIRAITPLVEFGIGSHVLNTKKLIGYPLWEVRVLGKDSIRIFYAIAIANRILILHGFIKKSQKTSTREINLALKRLYDWSSRHWSSRH
ncbi:MAG: Toxin-antitoxin system, toxin component, RelE family [Microgenomates group bacterium GW2011_GWA2_46_7]|nr:MAG: Toxin-antitoxin system, toxin component, RelE family [Microgenomates group bacterium GW2011_GWA2_46_7]